MKPLGYYVDSCTIDYAGELEKKLEDLTQTDKLGVIEWLTHRLAKDFRQIEAELEQAKTEGGQDAS